MQQFRDMNKVHEMGTVAEIAQKLDISKSEVRRRKANGTL
jgi:DNA-binding IclR family transcriptional regulator